MGKTYRLHWFRVLCTYKWGRTFSYILASAAVVFFGVLPETTLRQKLGYNYVISKMISGSTSEDTGKVEEEREER